MLARFADTQYESEDTYRFIDHVVALSGVEFETLSQGKDIWDVFMERKMMRHPRRGCLASYHLKRIPLIDHALSYAEPVTVMIGFGPDECDRVERLLAGNDHYEITYDFPLRWSPKWWHCDVKSELKKRGVTTWPKAYEEGMGHNNCGRRCVQGGVNYYSLLWLDRPDSFREEEVKESQFLTMLREEGRPEYTILRDRRGGTLKNMSLRQLRQELENGTRFPNERQRIKCGCDLATQMELFQLAQTSGD